MGNPHIHSCCSDGSIPAAFVHQQAMLLCWRLPLAAQVRETSGGASVVPNALNSTLALQTPARPSGLLRMRSLDPQPACDTTFVISGTRFKCGRPYA